MDKMYYCGLVPRNSQLCVGRSSVPRRKAVIHRREGEIGRGRFNTLNYTFIIRLPRLYSLARSQSFPDAADDYFRREEKAIIN